MMKNYAAILLITVFSLSALAGFGKGQETIDSYFDGQVRLSKPQDEQARPGVAGNQTAPANDNFADASVLTIGQGTGSVIAASNNMGASKEANEPNHADNAGGSSVWFKFTPTATKAYEIRTVSNETTFDTTLAVYKGGSLDNLIPVGANDDCFLEECGTRSRVRALLKSGTTYYIAVDGYNNGIGTAAGSFSLTVEAAAGTFEYDNLETAYDLATVGAGTIGGTNFMATSQPGEMAHANQTSGGRSVWYRFKTTTKRSMTFELNNDFGAEMAIYESMTATPGFANLTKVSDVADHIGLTSSKIQLSFYAEPGRYYFIAVDWNQQQTVEDAAGNFQLKFYGTKMRYSQRISRFDNLTSIGIFRPSEGKWYSLRDNNPAIGGMKHFGMNGDTAVPADYDGDGLTNYAVARDTNGLKRWYIMSQTDNGVYFDNFQWGLDTDIALSGDFDRDGRADPAVVRNQNGSLVWYVRRSSDLALRTFSFGLAQDRPVLGDFDGDGATDVTIVRNDGVNLVWYILKSDGSQYAQTTVTTFGLGSDLPTVEDFDGDGKTDVAVFRPSTGTWYITRSGSGQLQVTTYGASGDKPQAADYDGDGKADLGLFRPSTGDWYLWFSKSDGQKIVHWGKSGDIAVTSMSRFSEPIPIF